jgi:hypothetical protein
MTTSFILFLKDVRKDLTRRYPRLSQKEIASKGGEMWRDLPPERKAYYSNLAKEKFN